MARTRIFIDGPLAIGERIALPPESARHVARALRLRVGEPLVLFNGWGGEYTGWIASITRSQVEVQIVNFDPIERGSPLEIMLVQGISRGEHMDYTIQKAVELGVGLIAPVHTERSTVRLQAERSDRRLAHWRKIITGACEQCGCNRIPLLLAPQPLAQCLDLLSGGLKLVLVPGAEGGLSSLRAPDDSIVLLVGPEGGLTEAEVSEIRRAGYSAVGLGPRILRTETAALAALSAAQALWGDLR